MNSELDQALRTIVQDPLHPLASLSALVIKNGEMVYANAFGYRYIHPHDPAQNLPATPQTRYRVASISKLVTAIGLMKLHEAGQLDLQADVSEYLGFELRNPHFPTTPITLRMLLSHTSSIRDEAGYSYYLGEGMQDFFLPTGKRYAGGEAWDSQHAPGTFFCYSNLTFGVIGTVIEQVSGQRFDHYMRSSIFEPLGIHASYNVLDFSPDELDSLATLYRKQNLEGQWNPAGAWYPQVDDYHSEPPRDPDPGYLVGTNGTRFGPQGSLRASTLDLAQIALMLLKGGRVDGQPFLQPQTIALMFDNHWSFDGSNGDPYNGLMRSWGLGLQRFLDILDIADGLGGDRIVEGGGLKGFGHLGDAYGLFSAMILQPDQQNALIYMLGGQGCDPEGYRGKYSSFYRWEEQILSQLYRIIPTSPR